MLLKTIIEVVPDDSVSGGEAESVLLSPAQIAETTGETKGYDLFIDAAAAPGRKLIIWIPFSMNVEIDATDAVGFVISVACFCPCAHTLPPVPPLPNLLSFNRMFATQRHVSCIHKFHGHIYRCRHRWCTYSRWKERSQSRRRVVL
jgi:hypothetical protein